MIATHTTVRRFALGLLSFLLLASLAQTARADDIFGCGGLLANACGGTVTVSGSTYSSTVSDLLSNAPGVSGDDFTLTLNLTAGSSVGSATISDGTDTFTASDITSVTVSDGSSGLTTDIAFAADWTGSGPDFGGTDASDSGTVIFDVSNGQVTNVDVDLEASSDPPTNTPEPSTGLLLGAGLFGLGAWGIRKRASFA